MRHRLRPVRPPHHSRLRLTLATLLLPLLAIVVLVRSDVARRPLSEREAALAIDLQKARRGSRADEFPRSEHGNWNATAIAVVSRMPRLVTNRELQLRLAGVASGALALGLMVRLGTRLFAPRVGLVVALLMLALPTGRRLLGVELSVEPFYLTMMLGALLAMRGMVEARVAAVFAGLLAGFALALAGYDALWLPVLALAWLRVHQGLTLRSAGVVLGTAALGAALAFGAAWLLYGRVAGEAVLPLHIGSGAFLDATLLRPAPAAREMIPLLPLVLLGLWTMRRAWWQSDSFRFLLLWLVLAAASWALSGSAAGAYVAILFLATAIALLALEHASKLATLPACGVGLALALTLWQVPKPSEAQSIDRWAIREAGRFVGRVIKPERTVAASRSAARRFAYYGNRAIEPLASTRTLPADVDYALLPRSAFDDLREQKSHGKTPAKRIAEFGEWVIVRVGGSSE